MNTTRRWQLFALLTAMIALPGCGMLSWFDSDEDPHPPTPLTDQSLPLTAKVAWSTRLGKGTDGRELELAPVVFKQQVYVADAHGKIAALALRDGRPTWQRDTDYPLSGGPDVLDDQLVLSSTDGDVVAFSTTDGKEKWRSQLGVALLSAPRLATDVVIAHALDDSVHALDRRTGKARWNYTSPAPTLTLHGSSTPLVQNDAAIVGLAGGRLVSLELGQGAPNWELTITPPSGRSDIERMTDIDADPLVVGATVYVAAYNGDLAAVDLPTGAILWRRALSAYAGITAADQTLYITAADDTIWAAAPQDGVGQWKQEALRYRRLTAPAVDGNYLVVGDFEGWLHWIARRDGQLAGRVRVTKASISHRPVVANGQVLVYANDGTVAAVALQRATERGSK
ncbi:outer membrane protein assembly factor BamB [Rhodoferax sp. 4810]|uniref:Outer membrane protein assembly factor BamB n=1 Tax=Thiospirillum jenense TaxID=1653858 RepID=A0A839HHK0_9GAMM|nr:outer membrane protein assembly factor BamB [Thiospirillum jenense]MBB1074338.1 outer membrane protein assembly factor BamB [Rhodoferax jenense]MBB1126457.1 outer membrane protein assembly factor BamB [Thiospirillum jenense]